MCDHLKRYYVRKITDNVHAERTVSYSYDELGRLKTAATQGSGQWSMSWSYDRYGNRTNQELTGGTGYDVPLSFDPSTNHTNGLSFDPSGNVTLDNGTAYQYDGENRLVNYGNGGATYGFDGNGLRVKRTYAGSTTVYLFSGSQVIAEYASGSAPASPTREYIYSGGLLASVEGGTTKYYFPDQLSTRVTMSGSTTTEQGQHPFGENWYPTNPDEKWKFTSYERDVESGNDYAMFRSYVNRYGRFLTPDPAGVATADTTNPQTWNRYAYVGNDSVNFVDPLGLCPAPGVWLDPSVRRGCVFVTRVTGGSYLCSVDGARTDCGLAIALIHAGSAYPSSTGAGDCSAGVDGMVFCGPNEIPFNAADYIRSLPPGLTLQLTNYLRNTEAAAANNALFSDKQLSCAGKALKKNAFSLALDVAGFLPGGSLAGGFFQMGVDVASTIDSARKGDAVGAMVYGIGGFHTDAIQTAYRAGGFGAARGLLKSVGRSGAKAVPIFGTFLNLASTLKDVWDTYGDYTQCMSNSVR